MSPDTRLFRLEYRQFRKWHIEIIVSFDAAWERRKELLATPHVTQVKLPYIVE